MTDQTPPPGAGRPAPGPGTTTRPGQLLDRFLARLIDGVLLAVVDGIVVSGIVVGAIMGESDNVFTGDASWAAMAVSALLSAAIALGYFAYLESTQGRSVGKIVLRLRVLGPEGGNPTLEESLRRNCWVAFGALGVVPVVGGLLGGLAELAAVIMIAVGISSDTVNRQAWHDRFAGGTRVVKEG